MSSIYRALARYEKAQAYPEAVEQAHTEFAALAGAGHPADDIPRPRPARVHQPVNEELRDRLQSQQPPRPAGTGLTAHFSRIPVPPHQGKAPGSARREGVRPEGAPGLGQAEGRAEDAAAQSCCPGEDEHAAPPLRVGVPEPGRCVSEALHDAARRGVGAGPSAGARQTAPGSRVLPAERRLAGGSGG